MKFVFIEPELEPVDQKTVPNASYLRKSFQVGPGLKAARMYSTALGVYIPSLNGRELDERRLLPGFTDYDKRVQYQEYDILPYVTEGENVAACVLGDGWYRGNLGPFNKRFVYGQKTKFACAIHLTYEDREEWINTGEDWRSFQDGPLQANDLKKYEVYDAGKEMPGWNEAGFDDSGWHGCLLSEYGGAVIPMEGEPLLMQERFTPRVLHTPDGNTVLDFGQNLAGMVEFTVTGMAGTTASMVLGETLDKAGNFTMKNLQAEGKSGEKMGVGQKLTYTLKEGTQTYRPHFLISGFRYAKLEGWPEEVRAENFTSVAVYSRLRETGTFTCSNPAVNKLLQNIRWSLKSNFVDIPTDCPQRERAGWAGDINVFMETANYLTDTRAFLLKWMHDFMGAQMESGNLPVIAPKVPLFGDGTSSAGWSDAIATIPMAQYQCYGDTGLMREAYDAIKRYVECCRQMAKKTHPMNRLKRGYHRQYIVDTGFHFGEWLEPGSSNGGDALKAIALPDAEVATAWFYYSTSTLSRIAGVLGEKEDEARYGDLAQKIKMAYRKEFLSGKLPDSPRQCKYVRPLYMGLADTKTQKRLAKELNDLCVRNDYKIGTGFLTTYQILNVLTDNGYPETAYRMLEQEECPGWLYEVKQGATTIWEGWMAVKDGDPQMQSLNHYAPGAALSWLFSRCAGIRPAKPGYREILIRPIPGGTFRYAKASYDSVVGRIVSDWECQDGRFVLRVELPEGIPATVVLPDGSRYENAVTGTYECTLPV